jgi:hypothetical protein
MPKVVQVLKDGDPVEGIWEKKSTQGDAYQFVTAESGHVQIIHKDDTTTLPDGRARVTTGSDYIEVVLGFRYMVGFRQLQAEAVIDVYSGLLYGIPNRNTIDEARAAWLSWPISELRPTQVIYFQEISTDTVRIYNLGGRSIFQFSVPFTSLQAASRARIIVDAQGDNAAVEFLGEGDGILLKSRSGNRALLRIDDGMNLKVEPK